MRPLSLALVVVVTALSLRVDAAPPSKGERAPKAAASSSTKDGAASSASKDPAKPASTDGPKEGAPPSSAEETGVAPGAGVDEGAPSVPVVAVIADDDLPIHRRVVTGLVVEARAEVFDMNLGGDATLGPTVMKRALVEKPSVIVAVGPKSLVAATEATNDIPIVYCLVPRLEVYDLRLENVGGVRLETPASAPFQVLKRTLPSTRKVAVVFNPDESADLALDVARAARDVGMTVVPVEVRVPEQVREGLRKTRADAIVMVPDPTALHLSSFAAMLDHASENKLPLFALNARYVERGALLAFALDDAALGRQVGRVVNGLVEGEVKIDAVRALDPEGQELVYNLTTAKQVGTPASFSSALLDVAAERGTPVRVFR